MEQHNQTPIIAQELTSLLSTTAQMRQPWHRIVFDYTMMK